MSVPLGPARGPPWRPVLDIAAPEAGVAGPAAGSVVGPKGGRVVGGSVVQTSVHDGREGGRRFKPVRNLI